MAVTNAFKISCKICLKSTKLTPTSVDTITTSRFVDMEKFVFHFCEFMECHDKTLIRNCTRKGLKLSKNAHVVKPENESVDN